MEKEMALLWEVSLWEFLFVTVLLAGGAAWMTGRSVARAWESDARLVVFIILLTAATRFIHFALFDGTLLSVQYAIVDFAALLAMAFLGKLQTRRRQMATQYGFARKGGAG
ncbi:MAG: DUF6867 family protein [Pikeienuella sp.]